MLPFFERIEHFEQPGWPGRGAAGPIGVEFNRYRPAVLGAYFDACREAGIPVIEDVNGFPREGVGRGQASTWRGVRQSTAVTYLARPRPNLEIRSEARATAVLLEGSRCTGVRYRRGGVASVAGARRAVIVCGGTFGSPKLLMLSGIGPPDLLRRYGIAVQRALPGVGRNLQDHPGVSAGLAVRLPTVTDRDQRGLPALVHGLRWWLRGEGMAAGAAMIATGFVRSDPVEPEPDLYLQLAPFAIRPQAGAKLAFSSEPAITTIVSVARPQSRGVLEITSAEPEAPLRGALELLGDAEDRRRIVAALRLIGRLHATRALQGQSRADASAAGAGLAGCSDAALLEYAAANCGGQYHPVGTCRMGSDTLAVVDPGLRVHGFDNLFVADASIMPQVTSANTNAPTLMIGERAAQFVRAAK